MSSSPSSRAIARLNTRPRRATQSVRSSSPVACSTCSSEAPSCSSGSSASPRGRRAGAGWARTRRAAWPPPGAAAWGAPRVSGCGRFAPRRRCRCPVARRRDRRGQNRRRRGWRRRRCGDLDERPARRRDADAREALDNGHVAFAMQPRAAIARVDVLLASVQLGRVHEGSEATERVHRAPVEPLGLLVTRGLDD
eukprot:3921529-Prymnesium_polylepis.1